jgi:hypothetical protein
MENQENQITCRTEFKEIIFNNPHNFNYAAGFSKDSLILVFAIGIYELFARFKNKPLSNCLKPLKFELDKLSNKAKNEYPDQASIIDFYMLFLQEIEKFQDSVTAFKYLLANTILQQQNYVQMAGIGFRLMVSMLFENKPDYKAMIQCGTDLTKIKGLILYNICQTFCIQVEVYDEHEKEIHKGAKIGEFPILNLFTWNSNYYLLYNQSMIGEWNGIPIPDHDLDKPPFKLQRNTHAPIQSQPAPVQPQMNPLSAMNFNDTNAVLKQLVVKLSEELLSQNTFSEQFSDFVSLCVKHNQEVGTIRTLQKFINPFKEQTNKKIVVAEPDSSDILMESRISIERSARNVNSYRK